MTAGRSLSVCPAMNSTTGQAAADAVLTLFFTFAAVLALKAVSVSRYDLGGHSQL
jgi:hypothetical protein